MSDFLMKCDEVKTVGDCLEMVSVDAKDDEEVALDWFECLNEVFGEVKKVKLFGEETEFCGVDFFGDTRIVAVCKKKKKKVRVAPDSIELIKPTKSQKIWMKAWSKWAQ